MSTVRSCRLVRFTRAAWYRKSTATSTHERWSKDFVHDALFDGRAFRVLTVVDQYSRQSPVPEPAFAHSGGSVAEALERMVAKLGAPPGSPGSRHRVYVQGA